MYLVTKTRQIHPLLKTLLVSILASLFLASTPAYSDEVSDWRKQVARSFAKNHIYPRSAIAREIEGRARVQVVLNRTGEIISFDVIEPSGQEILDKTIPRLISKVSPLPQPPAGLSDANLTFIIPITWQTK